MKKWLAIVLCVVFAVSTLLLAACQKQESTSETGVEHETGAEDTGGYGGGEETGGYGGEEETGGYGGGEETGGYGN